MWRIFGLEEEMLASQKGLCSMKSVSQSVSQIVSQPVSQPASQTVSQSVSQSVSTTSLFQCFGEIKFLPVQGD